MARTQYVSSFLKNNALTTKPHKNDYIQNGYWNFWLCPVVLEITVAVYLRFLSIKYMMLLTRVKANAIQAKMKEYP